MDRPFTLVISPFDLRVMMARVRAVHRPNRQYRIMGMGAQDAVDADQVDVLIVGLVGTVLHQLTNMGGGTEGRAGVSTGLNMRYLQAIARWNVEAVSCAVQPLRAISARKLPPYMG